MLESTNHELFLTLEGLFLPSLIFFFSRHDILNRVCCFSATGTSFHYLAACIVSGEKCTVILTFRLQFPCAECASFSLRTFVTFSFVSHFQQCKFYVPMVWEFGETDIYCPWCYFVYLETVVQHLSFSFDASYALFLL